LANEPASNIWHAATCLFYALYEKIKTANNGFPQKMMMLIMMIIIIVIYQRTDSTDTWSIAERALQTQIRKGNKKESAYEKKHKEIKNT
jgi:p-aminobenzoyl-glutamate transporter AbgT